ncbi:MAG: preprotein translocase subunit SecG [Proteobacteria bacterium]|nr:preprotein translocase subunit SecG [Pseudomonadota bacterium]
MTLLVILHIVICIFLVCVILLQPGKADGGVAFGGSSSQSIFGSKGAGNFLTKTTSVCAILFLFTSFVLTRSRSMNSTKSVIGKEPISAIPQASKVEGAAAAKPIAPTTTPEKPAKK